MKFILIVLTLLLVSCDNPLEPEFTFLSIHLNSEKDSNGYYHIDYNGTTYELSTIRQHQTKEYNGEVKTHSVLIGCLIHMKNL